MFRLLVARNPPPNRFPRIRGDVPATSGTQPTTKPFSPHTRGCSEHFYQLITMLFVFPAYAGMFLSPLGTVGVDSGFPRIRGDVPFIW